MKMNYDEKELFRKMIENILDALAYARFFNGGIGNNGASEAIGKAKCSVDAMESILGLPPICWENVEFEGRIKSIHEDIMREEAE